MSLFGKCVVVTGASAGIGRAAAIAFGRERATVALLARGEDGLAGAARDVEAAGGRAFEHKVDVADADAVFAAADAVEAACGPIDIWVNDAMATIFAPVDRITPEEYRRATEVTYLGAVYGTMAALKRMKARGQGTIVQVGSALGYRAIPLQAPYCGAKYALRGFTNSLRAELIHDEVPVHLTMVVLGGFNTPQFEWARSKFDKRPQPVPPFFQPEVAADAIVFAATHKRREVFVGMPAVKLVLGNTLAPGLMDRILAKKAWSGQFTGEDETRGPARQSVPTGAGGFRPARKVRRARAAVKPAARRLKAPGHGAYGGGAVCGRGRRGRPLRRPPRQVEPTACPPIFRSP